MKKLKKIFLYIFSVFAFLFLAAWLLALKYGDEVKSMIITGINNNLKTPVSVGNIEFSFIRRFPYATLEFTNVVANGVNYDNRRSPLLKAARINLNFSLWDFFGNEVSIKKIIIEDAVAYIYIDSRGTDNYSVFKSSGEGDSHLRLNEIRLDDVSVFYINEYALQDYSFKVHSGTASGTFAAGNYELAADADMFVDYIKSRNTDYLTGKDVRLRSVLNIDNTSNVYTLRKTEVGIADLVLHATGKITQKQEHNLLSLELKSDDAGMKELLSLIPQRYLTNINHFKFNGKIDFKANIEGAAGKKDIPQVNIHFATNGSSVQPRNSDHKLSNIRLNGYYTNRKSDESPVSYLSFTNVKAMLDHQPVEGELLVENLPSPWINLKAKGRLDLATVSTFYMPDTLKYIKGEMILDMQFRGLVSKQSAYQSSGTVTLNDVSFALKNKSATFEHFNGLFHLNGNRFSVADLKGNASGSDIALKGSVDNLFSFLFEKNQVLRGNASLSSRNLDLSELLEDKKQSSKSDTAYFLDINNNLDFRLDVNIGMLSFRRFQAWDMKGSLHVKNKVLSTPSLTFKSMNGAFALGGSINASSRDSIRISCKASGVKVDIKDLFYETGNFGQNVITDQNLRGILTADVIFDGMWSKTLHCNTNTVVVSSDFTIEKGELIRFEPMLALAKYLKGADLHHIRFSTLSNSIEIRNRKIYIPSMEIKSSALEMTASGTHNFDNDVDYKMQFLLSQLVGAKVRKMNTEFGTIEDDGLGRSKIFLTMKGPLADPKVKYDSESVEKKIVQDIKNEKKNLRSALNREFGWFKNDTTIHEAKQQPKKKKELELEIEEESDTGEDF